MADDEGKLPRPAVRQSVRASLMARLHAPADAAQALCQHEAQLIHRPGFEGEATHQQPGCTLGFDFSNDHLVRPMSGHRFEQCKDRATAGDDMLAVRISLLEGRLFFRKFLGAAGDGGELTGGSGELGALSC